MKDQFERKIDYLRVSVTDFCNFRCAYCMPEEGVERKSHQDILSFEELYHIIHTFTQLGVKKVRVTGGEPLVRSGIDHFIQALGQLDSIKDLAMTTNASLLKERAKTLKESGLDRVNISLDTFSEETFNKLSRGNYQDSLDGIEAAMEAGLGVKINTVLLKGINDDEIEDFVGLTKKLPIDVRFIEVMPIGQTAQFCQDHFMSLEEVLDRVDLVEIKKDHPSSPADLYQVEGGLGRVGLIRPLSKHFCADCNRLRLTADGQIKVCLHSDVLVDLKTPLRRGENIKPYIEKALAIKPKGHHLLEGEIASQSMNNIGG